MPVDPSGDGSESWIESQADKTAHHQYTGDAQIFTLICRIRDKFGTEDAQHVLYDEGMEKCTDVQRLLYHAFYPPNHSVLAFVTNHAIAEQAASVKFNPEDLGLAGRNLKVLDTLYNRKMPIGDDGEFSLPRKLERWTYLWLKPGP